MKVEIKRVVSAEMTEQEFSILISALAFLNEEGRDAAAEDRGIAGEMRRALLNAYKD